MVAPVIAGIVFVGLAVEGLLLVEASKLATKVNRDNKEKQTRNKRIAKSASSQIQKQKQESKNKKIATEQSPAIVTGAQRAFEPGKEPIADGVFDEFGFSHTYSSTEFIYGETGGSYYALIGGASPQQWVSYVSTANYVNPVQTSVSNGFIPGQTLGGTTGYKYTTEIFSGKGLTKAEWNYTLDGGTPGIAGSSQMPNYQLWWWLYRDYSGTFTRYYAYLDRQVAVLRWSAPPLTSQTYILPAGKGNTIYIIFTRSAYTDVDANIRCSVGFGFQWFTPAAQSPPNQTEPTQAEFNIAANEFLYYYNNSNSLFNDNQTPPYGVSNTCVPFATVPTINGSYNWPSGTWDQQANTYTYAPLNFNGSPQDVYYSASSNGLVGPYNGVAPVLSIVKDFTKIETRAFIVNSKGVREITNIPSYIKDFNPDVIRTFSYTLKDTDPVSGRIILSSNSVDISSATLPTGVTRPSTFYNGSPAIFESFNSIEQFIDPAQILPASTFEYPIVATDASQGAYSYGTGQERYNSGEPYFHLIKQNVQTPYVSAPRFTFRTVGSRLPIPPAPSPGTSSFGSRFLWDKGYTIYCRRMLLAMGFQPTDLKP